VFIFKACILYEPSLRGKLQHRYNAWSLAIGTMKQEIGKCSPQTKIKATVYEKERTCIAFCSSNPMSTFFGNKICLNQTEDEGKGYVTLYAKPNPVSICSNENK